MAYDINDTSNLDNHSDRDDITKSKNIKKEPSHHSDEEEEEEEEEYEEEPTNNIKINQNIYSTQGIETSTTTTKKDLPSFDFTQFYNLNLDGEAKELLNMMNM
jgi:hypothetical protein